MGAATFPAAVVLMVLCVAVVPPAAAFHFMSIGDWGCVPVGGFGARDERVVAKSFADKAANLSAKFVLNTGDSFYRCGVHSKSDEVWNTTFEDVFHEDSMLVPWYSCIGNHDYGYPGSAEAEVEYVSPKNNRWVMPARYYYRRLVFPGEVNISLIVLDSSPCNKLYRGDDPKHWDPCGLHFDEKKCPGCSFHDNILKQDCSAQLAWLQSVLPSVPQEDWKIVMTHAPAHELDVEDLLTPLYHHNFELFINGHLHRLQEYGVAGKEAMNFVTTGAGCWVKVPESSEDATYDDHSDLELIVPHDGRTHTAATRPASMQSDKIARQENLGAIHWQSVVAGYTAHTFENNYQTLSTSYFNYLGEVVHKVSVQKRT
jgi:tartrate-resistant acid phosphatase type 5